jgi:hypothetical protein
MRLVCYTTACDGRIVCRSFSRRLMYRPALSELSPRQYRELLFQKTFIFDVIVFIVDRRCYATADR